ncbi:MAG: CpaF family protein [Candidatus Diapherotrites archaeon]|nr:CpaF family protein [Candidatus Diapherotrites archaeon]MBT4596488.1 CpaF family protein [Candidatus Diapherotrites archaeon]
MKFTDIKLAKLADTALGEIHKGLTHNFYDVKPVLLSEQEEVFAKTLEKVIQRKAPFSQLSSDALPENFEDKFREEITLAVELNGLLEKMPSRKVFVQLLESLIKLVAPISFIENKALFAEKVLHSSIGLKQLAFFSLEDDFEELMVNGLESVFVFHREYGVCKTNIVLDEKVFNNILQRIAFSIGTNFDYKNPLLDARLPDGSRVNATMKNVSPKGISLTIRKFSQVPMTMLDLIEKQTITSEAAAFLWMMTDGFAINAKNILVVGSTASGKTTMLNVLSNFIRLNERIVTIEDTLEVSLLDRENWIALEAKHTRGEEVMMDALLKNSLRMRPDRIVVGEVRGEEAVTLFTAMDNGHNGCLGTIHANSARDAMTKLREKPLAVPEAMLPLVDLVVVMQRKYSKDTGVSRKVSQIAEVTSMERKVLLANVFELNSNRLVKTDLPSQLLEDFAEQSSMTKNEVKKEIETRQIVLEWLLKKQIRKPQEVLEFIQSYYYDSEKVLSLIYGNDVEQTPTEQNDYQQV